MREIRFRAWDKKEKKIYNESLMIGNIGLGEGSVMVTKDVQKGNELIWMQFTGLKDKNGKEIYEGDILRIKNKRGKYWSKGRVLVVWGDCEFYAQKIDEEVIEDEECLGNYEFNNYDVKLIGNKFENPELLKKFQGEESNKIKEMKKSGRWGRSYARRKK